MNKDSHTRVLFCCLNVSLIILVVLHATFCLAQDVTIGWNSNKEPDLEGYVVYRNIGYSGPPYKYDDVLPEDDLADPLNPRITLTGIQAGTMYYAAVTAYDAAGNESGYSKEICFQIIEKSVKNCTSSAKRANGSGGGGGCFIGSATADPVSKFDIISAMFLVIGCAMALTQVVLAKILE